MKNTLDCMRIEGGNPLRGSIPISGAKNAVLPMMALTLLTDEPLHLEDVPLLADVYTMQALLESLGTRVTRVHKRFTLETNTLHSFSAPYDIVRKMRASVLTLGPLIARCGRAEVSLPGGCAIGARLLNWHLEGLQALGIKIDIINGYIVAKGKVRGGSYTFPKVSVTGTQNLIFAACLAQGETCLRNIAQEPEITHVITCLRQMGAVIEYQNSTTLLIQGIHKLKGTQCAMLPDRIEMGTYIMAAAITQGDVILEGADLSLLPTVVPILRQAGVILEELSPGRVRVSAPYRLAPFAIQTDPFPGFPTDLQAQLMAIASLADGHSNITETIYENRFMHVCELNRMGAYISVGGSSASIRGRSFLSGAQVMATDLRASVSLVVAALAARGETIVHRIYHLDRGYEALEEKLSACGANIRRSPRDEVLLHA